MAPRQNKQLETTFNLKNIINYLINLAPVLQILTTKYTKHFGKMAIGVKPKMNTVEAKNLNALMLNAEEALKEAMDNVDKIGRNIAKHVSILTKENEPATKHGAIEKQLGHLRYELIRGQSLVDDAQRLIADIKHSINKLKYSLI